MSSHKASAVERLALAVLLIREAYRANEPTKDMLKRLEGASEQALELMSERGLDAWNARKK